MAEKGGELCSPTLSHKISVSLPGICAAELLLPPDAPLLYTSAPSIQCTGQTEGRNVNAQQRVKSVFYGLRVPHLAT